MIASSVPFIALQHLSKHYAEGDQPRTIFTDLTLDIQRGEFVALLGPVRLRQIHFAQSARRH
jgi:ABC-type Fe3+/spermidine/putrescine transport system ATPase subunit